MEAGSFLFDFIGALIILLLLIGTLYTYTGNWPPLVVVQSGSMQHSDTESSVGVIDTGDLVFVKKVDDTSRIVTYVEGKQKGQSSYDAYGDVIIFKPNGNSSKTAIIHRAVILLVWNGTTYNVTTERGGSFDIPSLGLLNKRGSIVLDSYEWPRELRSRTLVINLSNIIDKFREYDREPHGGYLTKGDDNNIVDQTTDFGGDTRWLEPVEEDWVIGRSVGEIPWFGLIKLILEGNKEWPSNSMRNLVIAFVVIISLPFVVEFAYKGISSLIRKDEEEGAEPKTRLGARNLRGQERQQGVRTAHPPPFGTRSRRER
jgi:signal peptidase